VVDRALDPLRIRKFHLASPAQPASAKVDFWSTETERFTASEDASATTNFPLTKAALFHLSQIYPRSERFDDLVAEATRMLGPRDPLE